ncbi:hypothetical protein [Thalassospira marina]|uniref:hypothetical protein n=1 Tax=Thalassospira marina TaxID=2048283 RepID=UPI0012FEED50|nr:hypothetical protein [Thalassospira marina]
MITTPHRLGTGITEYVTPYFTSFARRWCVDLVVVGNLLNLKVNFNHAGLSGPDFPRRFAFGLHRMFSGAVSH